MSERPFERVIWIVLDSVGIGELPDAADYGDSGRDTLGHIARFRALRVPNLQRLGLANIKPLEHLAPAPNPEGSYGWGATVSPGKDTTTGHWEMAGVWLDQAFPVYPNGFPRSLIEEFERRIGRKTLCNKPASGTEIINALGEEHLRTGYPLFTRPATACSKSRHMRTSYLSPSSTACVKWPVSYSMGHTGWDA